MKTELIKQLEDIKDANATKLALLMKGELEKVAENYYASTIFGSEKTYLEKADYYNCQIEGKYRPLLWNNTLIFIPGNEAKVITSKKEQGIALGVVLIDYITKKVQIAAILDKDGEEYSYTSTVYNKETKAYETSTSKSACADYKELLNAFSTKLGADIDKFKE